LVLGRHRGWPGSAGQEVAQPRHLLFGELGGAGDLAAIQPEAAALGAEVDLETLESRLVEDRAALDATEVGGFRHEGRYYQLVAIRSSPLTPCTPPDRPPTRPSKRGWAMPSGTGPSARPRSPTPPG